MHAAAASTFVRFFPNVKRKYDYGVMVFILTFSLVAVSGARASEIWEMAHQRLTTIVIGGATCMGISVCICPVWAGQDLHNLIAANIDKDLVVKITHISMETLLEHWWASEAMCMPN